MKPAQFVTAVAHLGAGGRSGPIPALDPTSAWPEVVDLAVEHKVAPLLFEALSKAPSVPTAVLDSLEAELLRSIATRLLCESTLADVVRALRPVGIDLIVLKGPTVAHTLYPRPELRVYHDLDVLCRPSDFPGLRRALLSRGYQSDDPALPAELPCPPTASESYLVRGFYDPCGEVKLEVHFDVLQLGLIDRRQEQFWRESRPLRVGDFELRMLAPEHQFLQLATHAQRHGYCRLSWLIDLDLAVRRTEIDWTEVVRAARDEGVGAMLRYALATAHQVLGTPRPALPRPTLEELCLQACYRALWPFGRTRRLQQRMRHRPFQFLPESEDPRRVLYGLLMVGRRREKLRAMLQRHGYQP